MAQVEQYRIQAAEWERMAAEAKSPGGQECYRSLAQQWSQLADAVERLEREGSSDSRPGPSQQAELLHEETEHGRYWADKFKDSPSEEGRAFRRGCEPRTKR
jgi:hypothetical protein